MVADLNRLAELRDAPKNQIGANLRLASEAQLAFYFAAWEMVPMLITIAKTAGEARAWAAEAANGSPYAWEQAAKAYAELDKALLLLSAEPVA